MSINLPGKILVNWRLKLKRLSLHAHPAGPLHAAVLIAGSRTYVSVNPKPYRKPSTLQDEDVIRLFSDGASEADAVAAVRVIRDAETNLGKGFGFVLFNRWATKP